MLCTGRTANAEFESCTNHTATQQHLLFTKGFHYHLITAEAIEREPKQSLFGRYLLKVDI